MVAGPGSGKTRVLTQRLARFIREGVVPPHRTLAVTFTVKATHEMKQRLRADLGSQARGAEVRTLHSLALSIVLRDPKAAGAPSSFEIGPTATRMDVIIEEVLDDLIAGDFDMPPHLLAPQNALGAIRDLKHSNPFLLIRGAPDPEVRLARAFDSALHATNTVTFDDLGVMALRALDRSPGLLRSVQARHRAVFVDEYQDINRTQFELLRRVAAHRVLTVVGDDDQCIYGWRGADPDFLRSFPEDFPGATTVFLRLNHRSPGNVVEAASSVVGNNMARIPKVLRSAKPGGARIRVRRWPTLDDELSAVVDEVGWLIARGTAPSDVGVLARNNDLVQSIVVRLRARGIPVRSENPLRTTEGAAILDVLKTVLHGPGDVHFQVAVNVGSRRLRKSKFRELTLGRAVGPSEVEELLREWVTDAAAEVDDSARATRRLLSALDGARATVDTTSPVEILETLFERLGIWKHPVSSPRAERVTAAARLALEVSRYSDTGDYRVGFEQVVAELQELRHANEDTGDTLSVTTVHRAKGLEFTHVFLLGVQNDIFPVLHYAEQDVALLEEERRLFYVALTRPKKTLAISNHGVTPSETGRFGEKFVGEIPDELVEVV